MAPGTGSRHAATRTASGRSTTAPTAGQVPGATWPPAGTGSRTAGCGNGDDDRRTAGAVATAEPYHYREPTRWLAWPSPTSMPGRATTSSGCGPCSARTARVVIVATAEACVAETFDLAWRASPQAASKDLAGRDQAAAVAEVRPAAPSASTRESLRTGILRNRLPHHSREPGRAR